MGKLLDPQTAKLVNAIDEFMENPPQDMPQELSGQLGDLGKGLRGYGVPAEEMSPGQREAASKQTEGTGESYAVVGTRRGEPQKSPGQSEFDKHMAAAQEAFHAQTPDNASGA